PNQLWVADITYIALPGRFIYVAVILDAWSRLIVGYAISRSIDARLTVAALKAAIARREPPPGLGSFCLRRRPKERLQAHGAFSNAAILPISGHRLLPTNSRRDSNCWPPPERAR
ncbi:MAG TPA: DDE-type integrase/transposase/recombinase, partial [Nitrospiraceae bacterium]|nr:DDE-type integrase/transposase/recombinase [Nitrospiraceae bacterium]